MKLYLHIGTEKTGTTSIQGLLYRNRAALKSAGILVPSSLGLANHTAIAAYASADDKRDDLRADRRIRTAADLRDFRDATRRAFSKEVAESGCSSVIVSNEHCHSRLLTIEEVERTTELFDGFDVRILAYLRRQDLVAVSHYSTHLKNGGTRLDIFPDSEAWRDYYEYAKMLDRWATVYGGATVDAFLFDHASAAEGGLLGHFRRRTQIDHLALIDPPRANQSISTLGGALLLAMNPSLPKYVDGVKQAGRGQIAKFIEEAFPGTDILPPRHQAEAFYESYAADNAVLSSRWFKSRRKSPFSRDFSRYPLEQIWPPEIGSTELGAAFAEIWRREGAARAAELEKVRGRLARILLRSGRREQAEQQIRLILGADPNSHVGLQLLASLQKS